MNIIFLDVDGVLNSTTKLIEIYNKTNKPHSLYSYPFDEKCLYNLQSLVKQTASKLVITSTWRKTTEGITKLTNTLSKYNLDKEIIGITPILNKKREIEIKTFLSNLNYNPNFVILDDNCDMGSLLPFLIKTNVKTGLTKENVEEAILKLNKNQKIKQKRI